MFYNYDEIYKYVYIEKLAKYTVFANLLFAQHAFNVSYNGALSSVLCQIIKALLYACLCVNQQERRSPNGSRSDVMLHMFVITFPKEMRN